MDLRLYLEKSKTSSNPIPSAANGQNAITVLSRYVLSPHGREHQQHFR